MPLNFNALNDQPRLLISVQLKPVQGSRFQPTGFPDLGAATYSGLTDSGEKMECLLVESAQSMANRLEGVCWDEANSDLIPELQGLPYVKSTLPDGEQTDSIREAHRLNSPYIYNSPEFKKSIEPAIGFEANKPFDRRKLASALLQFDPSSLLHGTFLEKVGGVVRLPRVLSGFVEADGVQRVDSGGVKFDRVQPASGESTPYGKASEGYGNVPYHRTEFAAQSITAYFSVDLAQLRGYGLGDAANQLLTALALFKIQELLHSGLRFRTACDFDAIETTVTRPADFSLPSREELKNGLPELINACSESFATPRVTNVTYGKSK
ncbi:type I-U CRISPR-associated RAMP protein Csb1/Cas7u [Marinobacter sp.]|uniref:type I-G CRISPR-associated RAMP protein Csb1/Cas7g n=1 Tax=Pseudomonadati TaxID=3379134 RepID=UPI003A93A127